MNWTPEVVSKIDIALRKFERNHGFSERLTLSEPYDLMFGGNDEKYPNSDSAGVYIFAVEEGVLNIGKSKNKIGAQLHVDAKGWVTEKYFAANRPVYLFTVPTPVFHPSLQTEVPLTLERFLQKELNPIEP